MKKLLFCAILAAALLFSFGACSGDGQGENNTQGNLQENSEEYMINITINGVSAVIQLEKNTATDALLKKLEEGNISYTAEDYGGFEKVGALGFSLPTENKYITAQPGDVMLYQGNQLVIFYGQNGWQYTPIGRIEGLTQEQLEELLSAGRGDVTVNLSL